MRHRIKVWWRSCSRTLGLMTENSCHGHVCKLRQSNLIALWYQSPCIWHMNGRLHVEAKWKQSVHGEVFEWHARPLETSNARKEGNCRDHSGSQMACTNQTGIRCKLQSMQKGTRTVTTRCEHWKFAGGDVWAHRQCLLRWNDDNRHGCPPLHLETSAWRHASCTNTSD